MDNKEIIQNICLGLFGAAVLIGFLMMFILGIWKSDFGFHGGRIRGKLARLVGVIGLVGIAAGTYLSVSLFLFDTTPPLATVAGLLVLLLIITLLMVRFLAIFMRHKINA
jgi:hypothetical protein